MSSEMAVSYRNTKRHHNPEDHDWNLHRREKLNCRKQISSLWK
jgi:hypothetical protein